MWSVLLALIGCCNCAVLPDDVLPDAALALPADAAIGDELVLRVARFEPVGDWVDEDAPGLRLRVTVGDTRRDMVLPGGVGPVTQEVSLGAWDGGPLRWSADGDAAGWEAAASIRIDPAAAGVPVLGTYDAAWWNDTPLVTYVEDGTWTWVFTDEDGGTGLVPTLLMATWGRPVDIEGLYDADSASIQTTDHAWVGFDGPYEDTHPLFEVITTNGMIGPLSDAPYLLSPMPLAFSTEGGAVQRERVLDEDPWVLAASWAEADREGRVAPDGGQDDYLLGAPEDYVFLDHDVSGGARVTFEAEVDGTWWSSANGLSTRDGLTDARSGGLGRTCIELPPGADHTQVTALRVVSHTDAGAVSARWFRYDPATFAPIELGAATAVAFAAGGSAELR